MEGYAYRIMCSCWVGECVSLQCIETLVLLLSSHMLTDLVNERG
jgi:hypothetical protein